MSELADELNNDPETIGYGPFITSKNVPALASLINNPEKATINRQSISRDEFLMAIVPGIGNLLTTTQENQAKYNSVLGLVKAANSIALTPTVKALVNGLVTDGILTDVSGILTKSGSRAEAILGEGTYVSETEIGDALWGEDR